MRKRALIVLVFALLIFNLTFAVTATDATVDDSTDTTDTAEDNTETSEEDDLIITPETETDLSGVDKAFDCLKDSVEGKCSSLSFDEKVFTVLAIGECKEELKAESDNGKCWPKSSCNIKDTALALWALNERGANTEDAENWLFTQNGTPSELSWFLEIESTEETLCKISYSGSDYTISINEDKIINSDAGTCLSRSVDNYWLRVSPSCYDKEFEISCNNDFLTTFLYKRSDSSVLHVSGDVTSSSAEGTIKEKLNSACFANGGVCDYEGTLWASLILDTRPDSDYDLSAYIPYLLTMSDKNEKLLPESFLYLLLGHEDFRNDILLKQKKSKYWDESGNKFYDTAVALLPFSDSSVQEKKNSIDWLLDIQDDSGCFNNENKRDTAFLLYSLWLERAPENEDDESKSLPDCEASGKYCMSGASCDSENILTGYKCSGVFKCCNVPKKEKTCSELNGEVCNSNQVCIGSSSLEDTSASDLSYGEICCIGGACEAGSVEEENTCEEKGYRCSDSGCKSTEEEVSWETCEFDSQTCCKEVEDEKKSYLWLWIVLILLIILIIVAIIFRDKLRPYWNKITSRSKKNGSSNQGQLPKRPSSGFGRPPSRPMPRGVGMRPPQRRPIPRGPPQRRTLPMNRPAQKIIPRQKPRPELNETLNKIKDMSKK